MSIFKALVASLSDCGRETLTTEQRKLNFGLLIEAGWYVGNKKQKAEEQEIYTTLLKAQVTGSAGMFQASPKGRHNLVPIIRDMVQLLKFVLVSLLRLLGQLS